MDWDGIGTFALFIASGGIGMSLMGLLAYKARLEAKLEEARIRASSRAPSDEVIAQMRILEDQVEKLTERADFTDRLLAERSEVGVIGSED